MRIRRAVTAAIILAAILPAIAFSDTIPDGPGGPQIAVENTSKLADATLARYLPYFQQALNQFCAAWHCTGTLYLGKPKSPRDWPILLNNESDQLGAIGYHGTCTTDTAPCDSSQVGTPYAEVSILTAQENKMPWGVTFTHELDEMLADPQAAAADMTGCASTNMGTGAPQDCTFYMHEVCDPVQGESYRLGPIHVSDFVYRSWFMPGAPGPYDAGRHLAAPLTLAPKSFLSVYTAGAWSQKDTFTARTVRGGDWDKFGNR